MFAVFISTKERAKAGKREKERAKARTCYLNCYHVPDADDLHFGSRLKSNRDELREDLARER